LQRGFPRVSLDFNGFMCILQGVLPGRVSIDLRAFYKGHLLGFHYISMDLRAFCKGYPLGLH